MSRLTTRIHSLFGKTPEELLGSVVHITWKGYMAGEAYLRISAIETGPRLHIQQPAPFDRIWCANELEAHCAGEDAVNNRKIVSMRVL